MIRHLLSCLIALTLATSSVEAAVMQSEMQGAAQMEICADASGGVTTITLDATGKPITAAHHCPDCTAAHAALLPGVSRLARVSLPTRHDRPLQSRQILTTTPPHQSARDPPTFA